MTPEAIISLIQNHVWSDFSITLTEIDMLKRYFLRKYCKWLSLRQIAMLTGFSDTNHASVVYAIRVVENDKRFILIKAVISQKIDREIGVSTHHLKEISKILRS